MNKYKQIEALFEDFGRIEGRFVGDRKRFNYVAPDSAHSAITELGYGKRLELNCVDVTNQPLDVEFDVSGDISARRYYVRLTACMPDWRKYLNNLKISVNGTVIYDYDNTLFENVCVGWPVTYYPFDVSLLNVGKNVVNVSTTNYSGGGLYVAKVDLLTLPAIEDGMQISSQRYARIGSQFTIALSCKKDVTIVQNDGIDIVEIKRNELDLSLVLIKCVATKQDVSLSVDYCGKLIPILCPIIVSASDDEFLVGIDNDDNRQDYTEEGDRVPMIFALTGIGNYFQFRPRLYRSMAEFPDKETWIKRTKWLYDFNIKLSLCDRENMLSFLADVDPKLYIGKHCHETYLYFSKYNRAIESSCKLFHIDMDKISQTTTYGENKALYMQALDEMYADQKTTAGLDSVGAPSLMAVYEASKFPRVTMEPVSGVNLLLGATRGSCQGKWGAHIPICWYYGYYNDICKARKYWNTMFYCYLNGADYVYAENGLFKSQSMSREDWDTDFSVINRQFTKDMYDYSITHPRKGQLQIPFACVFGNNEWILWQKDSRIPELEDCGDWDLDLWGKWKENDTLLCWRAIDAWLPVASNQNTVDDKYNLSLHSGTRFGSIDVIPYEKDYSQYKLITFLGWNTYESTLAGKIQKYVQNGGAAFMSYCHFNKADNRNLPFEYATDDAVNNLLGFSASKIIDSNADIVIDGDNYVNGGGVKLVVPEKLDGEPICYDKDGHVILYRRKIGKGYLYLCTFATYYGYKWSVDVIKKLLENVSYGLCTSYCDNGNIAYTERIVDGKHVFHFINMSSGSENKQTFTISLKKGNDIVSKTDEIGVCEIKEIVI